MENDYVMLGEEDYREKLRLLQVYAEKWELSEIEFQPGLSGNNLIFYAVSRQYGRVIFKILLNNGFDKEIFALRLFQGRNFCSLYEYSLEDMVYLMERIVRRFCLILRRQKPSYRRSAGSIRAGCFCTVIFTMRTY